MICTPRGTFPTGSLGEISGLQHHDELTFRAGMAGEYRNGNRTAPGAHPQRYPHFLETEGERMHPPLWPLAVFSLFVIVLVTALLCLSSLLGERHRERRTGSPYESGIIPTGSARRRIPVHYQLVAVAFVIFDLEAAYLFAWAAAFQELGWTGYIEVLVFIFILLAALVYFWRSGALDWCQRPSRSAATDRFEELPDR